MSLFKIQSYKFIQEKFGIKSNESKKDDLSHKI
jgi:hypothetical protein